MANVNEGHSFTVDGSQVIGGQAFITIYGKGRGSGDDNYARVIVRQGSMTAAPLFDSIVSTVPASAALQVTNSGFQVAGGQALYIECGNVSSFSTWSDGKIISEVNPMANAGTVLSLSITAGFNEKDSANDWDDAVALINITRSI